MKKEKRKVVIIIASIISVLIIAVMLACYFSKNKEMETSVQPTDELLGEETINDIDEIQENIIEENIIEEDIESTKSDNEQNNTVNKNKDNTNKNNQMPYYIKVNYGAQVVTIYKKDANGDYTVPVKAMICSTGTATPTSGVYSIPGRWTWGTLFGNVYGQYCIKITGNILFHSVPYLRKGDPGSIEYWEYDKLGTAASAGCIRLKVDDLIWLYNNCGNGTKVEFYSSSNPGPLGKPSAQKISGNETCRNWDPTDPNPNNPWKNYKKQETNNSKKETTNNTKNNNVNGNNTNTNNKNNNNENNSNVNSNNNINSNNKNDNNINDNNINSSNTNNDKQNNVTNNSEKNEMVNKDSSKDNQKQKNSEV